MITWSWNGRLVSAGAMRVYTDDRIVVREEGRDLLLREVSIEDRGEWSCTVQLKQEPVSLAHRLEILVAPSISLDHSQVSRENLMDFSSHYHINMFRRLLVWRRAPPPSSRALPLVSLRPLFTG